MFVLKVLANRHASSTNTFLRALHRSGCITLNKEIMKPNQTDAIIQGIKSAKNTVDLLDFLSTNNKPLTSEQVLLSLKTIFSFEKNTNATKKNSNIINHPEFEPLLRELRRTSRNFLLNDIIETLKILAYIGVPTNANITYVLLNFLRRQINDVTLGHVIFLDFLLNKYEKTPLIEALQIALPIIFQLQLQTQIDHENIPQLLEYLHFASRHRVSGQSIMSIITALTLHGTKLSLEEAKSAVWSLCELHPFKPGYEKLLDNCFSVFNQNYRNFSYESIDSTLTFITNKYHMNNLKFYNEEFFNKCASFAIEMDVGFENALYILKKFNKINFVSIPLLDYIAEKVNKNLSDLKNATPLLYFNFILGFANANYIPKQWDNIEKSILSNPLLKSDKLDLSWLKLTTELISLNVHSNDLLEKVLDDNFLRSYLARDSNTLNYLQLIAIFQYALIIAKNYNGPLPSQEIIDKSIKLNLDRQDFPLQASLEAIFKGPAVYTKVTSKFGHLIDHVIVFDAQGEPSEMNSDNEGNMRYIEDLQQEDTQLIAVLAFPKSYYALNIPRLRSIFHLRLRILETLGISTVPVNLSMWTQLPEKEKLPYLEREIKYKLTSRGCEIETNA